MADNDIADWDQYCWICCGTEGDLLCCETCPAVAHHYCLGFKEEPDENDVWYCDQCKCHGCNQPCTVGKRVDLDSISLSVPARTAALRPGTSQFNPLLWPKGGYVSPLQMRSWLQCGRQLLCQERQPMPRGPTIKAPKIKPTQPGMYTAIAMPIVDTTNYEKTVQQFLDLCMPCQTQVEVAEKLQFVFPMRQGSARANQPLKDLMFLLLPKLEWKGRMPAINQVASKLWQLVQKARGEGEAFALVPPQHDPMAAYSRPPQRGPRAAGGAAAAKRKHSADGVAVPGAAPAPAPAPAATKSIRPPDSPRSRAALSAAMVSSLGPYELRHSYACCACCEAKFHLGCITPESQHAVLSKEPFFCSADCASVSKQLAEVCGRGMMKIDSLADGTPVCVQLVKGAAVTGARPGSKGHSTTYEHQEQAALLTVLSDSQAVLEEGFALLVGSSDPQECLLQLMTHGWSAPDRSADLSNMHVGVLWVGATICSVAVFRAFGRHMAEVPLLATRAEYRHKSLASHLLRGIEETMVKLGVRQLLSPCFQPELAGSSAQHSWSCSRGYELAGRAESLTAMRYGMLRFSGLHTVCKKLNGTSIFKTQPFVVSPHHALLGLHGSAEAAAEEAASTLSLFKNVDDEKPSRAAGSHPSLVRQPRPAATTAASRSNSLPKSPHSKKQQRQQQLQAHHAAVSAAEVDESSHHHMDAAAMAAAAAGVPTLAADGTLLLPPGSYGGMPMHVYDPQQQQAAAGRGRRDDDDASSDDGGDGYSVKRSRAPAGKGAKGRSSKKAAVEDTYAAQQASYEAAAAAAAQQAEQEAEAAAAQAQAAAAAAAAGLVPPGYMQTLALTADGYQQQQYTLEGLPPGAGLVYYVQGLPGVSAGAYQMNELGELVPLQLAQLAQLKSPEGEDASAAAAASPVKKKRILDSFAAAEEDHQQQHGVQHHAQQHVQHQHHAQQHQQQGLADGHELRRGTRQRVKTARMAEAEEVEELLQEEEAIAAKQRAAVARQYRTAPSQQYIPSTAALQTASTAAATTTYLPDTTAQLIAPGIYNIGGVPMMLTLDGVGDATYQAMMQVPGAADMQAAAAGSKPMAAADRKGANIMGRA